MTQQIKSKQVKEDAVVSGRETQTQIDQNMKKILHSYKDVFRNDGRIGRAKDVEPVHIEIDKSVKPIQQKRRPVPLK